MTCTGQQGDSLTSASLPGNTVSPSSGTLSHDPVAGSAARAEIQVATECCLEAVGIARLLRALAIVIAVAGRCGSPALAPVAPCATDRNSPMPLAVGLDVATIEAAVRPAASLIVSYGLNLREVIIAAASNRVQSAHAL